MTVFIAKIDDAMLGICATQARAVKECEDYAIRTWPTYLPVFTWTETAAGLEGWGLAGGVKNFVVANIYPYQVLE